MSFTESIGRKVLSSEEVSNDEKKHLEETYTIYYTGPLASGGAEWQLVYAARHQKKEIM